MMTPKIYRFAAWSLLAFIVFVTVSPIGLRPHDALSVDLDRAAAFAVTTAAFVLAYPRRWLLVAIAMVLGAMSIEMLQLLSPTRHAKLDDAGIKAVGAAFGVLVGWSANWFQTRRRA